MKWLAKNWIWLLIVLVVLYLIYQAYLAALTALNNVGRGLSAVGNAPVNTITSINNAFTSDVASIWNWIAGTGVFGSSAQQSSTMVTPVERPLWSSAVERTGSNLKKPSAGSSSNRGY